MEDFVSSSSFKSVLSCSEGQAQSVESSWTDYFVDFMLSEEKRRQNASYCATEGKDGDGRGNHDDEEEEDFMISDAASRAPAVALLPNKYKELKKLKKAFKALNNDDCLEDTASSPVNSPKVSILSQMDLSPKRRSNIRDLTTKEGGISPEDNDHRMEGMDCTDATMEGVSFVDPNERSITQCAELMDKGICLFPLSMLVHYHKRN